MHSENLHAFYGVTAPLSHYPLARWLIPLFGGGREGSNGMELSVGKKMVVAKSLIWGGWLMDGNRMAWARRWFRLHSACQSLQVGGTTGSPPSHLASEKMKFSEKCYYGRQQRLSSADTALQSLQVHLSEQEWITPCYVVFSSWNEWCLLSWIYHM